LQLAEQGFAPMSAFLVWLSLYIIEVASALTVLFLALRWALRHVSDEVLLLAIDVANLREKFRSVKKQSAETKLIVPSRGLSGR
jgi:hypothetical protein